MGDEFIESVMCNEVMSFSKWVIGNEVMRVIELVMSNEVMSVSKWVMSN